jgi:hypothetical protein
MKKEWISPKITTLELNSGSIPGASEVSVFSS